MDIADAVRNWVDVWQRAWPAKDVDAIDALYADEHVYLSHPFRAPDSARTYVTRAFGEEELLECRFGTPVVDNDRAAVEYFAILREGSTEHTLAGVAVLRFVDGLVVEHRDYWAMTEGALLGVLDRASAQ